MKRVKENSKMPTLGFSYAHFQEKKKKKMKVKAERNLRSTKSTFIRELFNLKANSSSCQEEKGTEKCNVNHTDLC